MDVTMPDGTVIQGVPEGTTKAQLQAKYAAHIGGASTAEPQNLQDAPRWDVLGDIGRAAKDSASALSQDYSAALPGLSTSPAGSALKMDLGPIASLQRMGSALKMPLDAMGILASPVTGAIHGLAGSALSYLVPTPPKDVDISGQHFYSDPKKAADQIIDNSLLGLAPSDPAAFAAAGPARAAARQAMADTKLTNKALDRVRGRVEADQLNLQDIVAQQQAALSNGDQLTLMDLGGPNVRGLAGAVYRAPGPARQAIDTALESRDAGAAGALTNDIQGNIARGSTYNATQDLIDARSRASQPAFRDAFSADSTAPFESQFRTALTKATGAKGQIAKQIADIEQNNPGALAARGAAGKAVRERYMDLRQQLDQAESDRQTALQVFQKAQADRTANAPGATWSPRLQQFLDNPEVQSGLRQALKLEKQDAITEGRPFKDSDYSITGYDANGDPIVGAVPTMKSLAVAKEGLDARIADMVDPNTKRLTKAGLSLKRFRDAFVNELDTLNPKYKVARDQWGGPSQSMQAVRDGQQHFSRPESNEQVRSEFDALSPSDKDFYRLGAAEAKVDAVERAPDASDKSKRVINNERDRKRFRMLFDSDAQAQQFIDAVARKRQQFDTRQAIKGGSQTAGRVADDMNENVPLMLDAAAGLGHAASNNWLSAAGSFYRLKRDLGLRNNPALNSEIARIMLNPDLGAAGLGTLNTLPLPKLGSRMLLPLTTDVISASQGGSKK